MSAASQLRVLFCEARETRVVRGDLPGTLEGRGTAPGVARSNVGAHEPRMDHDAVALVVPGSLEGLRGLRVAPALDSARAEALRS